MRDWQFGLVRVASDNATFAYVPDVFILPDAHRARALKMAAVGGIGAPSSGGSGAGVWLPRTPIR